jgi:hypothetical protein
MQKMVIKAVAPQRKRRAIELFSTELNFRPKVVANKKAYRRREKHRNREA